MRIDRLDEAEVPLLDEVEEQHAAADVAFRDGDDEAQVRLGETLRRLLVAVVHALGERDFLLRRQEGHASDLLEVHAHGVVDAHALGDGEVDLDLFVVLLRQVVLRLALRAVIDDLDALLAEGLVHPVNLVR